MQITYTSKLTDVVLDELNEVAQKFKTSKREIIETALNQYFERIKKAEYVASFKRAKGDTELTELADMGLEDYLNIIEK
jgi:predicted transcriptional regulator